MAQIKSLGIITIASGGTPVPIWDPATKDPHYKVTKIRIVPLRGNAGDIFIGIGASFNKSTGVGVIDHITKEPTTGAGDRFLIESHDVNTLFPATIYIDGTTNDGAVVSVVEA
jgi:hypothetical protein